MIFIHVLHIQQHSKYIHINLYIYLSIDRLGLIPSVVLHIPRFPICPITIAKRYQNLIRDALKRIISIYYYVNLLTRWN